MSLLKFDLCHPHDAPARKVPFETHSKALLDLVHADVVRPQ
jgi:hypothetical protein